MGDILSVPSQDQDLSKHPDVGIHMTRLVRLKLPSTVVELWRIWAAMLDIVASGAEVMATGPCRSCENVGVSPETRPSVSERLRQHVLPDIFWDSKSIGVFGVPAMACF